MPSHNLAPRVFPALKSKMVLEKHRQGNPGIKTGSAIMAGIASLSQNVKLSDFPLLISPRIQLSKESSTPFSDRGEKLGEGKKVNRAVSLCDALKNFTELE